MHQLYLAYVLGLDTERCTNRVLKLKFRGRKAVALMLKREHSDCRFHQGRKLLHYFLLDYFHHFWNLEVRDRGWSHRYLHLQILNLGYNLPRHHNCWWKLFENHLNMRKKEIWWLTFCSDKSLKLKLQYHSSEIRGLCLIKWSALKFVIFYIYENPKLFFRFFHFVLIIFFHNECPGLCRHGPGHS